MNTLANVGVIGEVVLGDLLHGKAYAGKKATLAEVAPRAKGFTQAKGYRYRKLTDEERTVSLTVQFRRQQMNNRMVSVIVLLCVVSLSTGCTRTMVVYHENENNEAVRLEGIPFYVKQGFYRQATVYKRSYLNVTLQIIDLEAIDNAAPREYPRVEIVRSVPNTQAAREEIVDLQEALNQNDITARKAVDEIRALTRFDPAEWEWSEDPVSNTVSLVSEVNYGQTFYVNSRAPWFGSGSLDVELNADGTLTTADAAVEPSIAEGLPSIVPFKEYLEGRYVEETPAAAGDDARMNLMTGAQQRDMPNVKLTLDIEEVGELKTLERIFDEDPRQRAGFSAIGKDDTDALFTIRPLAAASEQAGGSNENYNAWRLSGALLPPQAQGGDD